MTDQANAGGLLRERDALSASVAGPWASAGDLALVQRLRARDEQAFSALVTQYHGSMVRLAFAFVASRAVAEEVVQETWLGVLDGLPRFEGRSTLQTWILRILTNRAKTRGTREHRQIPFSSLDDPDEGAEPAVDPARFGRHGMWGSPPRRWDEDTADRRLMTQQALRCLEGALEALPAAQRAVVMLRDIDGLDAEEVCKVLEISEPNQRVLLHRGRAKLRATLEEYVEQK